MGGFRSIRAMPGMVMRRGKEDRVSKESAQSMYAIKTSIKSPAKSDLHEYDDSGRCNNNSLPICFIYQCSRF